MEVSTNAEMMEFIHNEQRRKVELIKRVNHCCGRRRNRDCLYLCTRCPDDQLATVILQETRGIRS